MPHTFTKLDLFQGKRFNQGDGFFIGCKTSQTEIGKQKEPTFLTALKSLNINKENK